MKALVLLALVACNEPPARAKAGTPEELAAYLKTVAGADEISHCLGWLG